MLYKIPLSCLCCEHVVYRAAYPYGLPTATFRNQLFHMLYVSRRTVRSIT